MSIPDYSLSCVVIELKLVTMFFFVQALLLILLRGTQVLYQHRDQDPGQLIEGFTLAGFSCLEIGLAARQGNTLDKLLIRHPLLPPLVRLTYSRQDQHGHTHHQHLRHHPVPLLDSKQA